MLVLAPLFFSLGEVTRARRFTSLENNTPGIEKEREKERERNQASREQAWCCLRAARNVRGHSSMTARLTYAVNYANSYGMRSFVRFQQQREREERERESEKRLNETQEGKERRRERERERRHSLLYKLLDV